MPVRDEIKSSLIEQLWIPTCVKGGMVLSKKKKRKELTVLTLTSRSNCDEVRRFIEEGLTERELTYVWTGSYYERVWLETELGDVHFIGPERLEDAVHNFNGSLNNAYPFHIINLDFSSQNPVLEEGRIEQELESLETIIYNQSRKNVDFILIYTTILDGHHIDVTNICDASEQQMLLGWPGITLDERFLQGPVCDLEDKVEVIEAIIIEMANKYNYKIELKTLTVPDENIGAILSVASLIRRL